MKHIRKTSEPNDFAEWKARHEAALQDIGANAGALWDYFGKNPDGAKTALKRRLLEK